MQQADRAHSATGTFASPDNPNPITVFMASRRSVLAGTFGAIGTSVLVAAPVIAAPAVITVLAVSAVTPVMAAITAEIAACERYDGLPPDLEQTNPTLHAAEEQLLTVAWDRMVQAEPENWHDLIAQVSHLTEDGEFDLLEGHMPLILRRMRRLAA
jgi:hypothetical protein